MHHCSGIGARADADVIAFDCANKSFCHSIALWTFDGRRSRFKADIASEGAGIASDIATAIVAKPFDGVRQAIYRTEPLLDRLRERGVFLTPDLARRMRRFDWTTDLRYETGRRDTGETNGLLRTARAIYQWVEGQIS